MLNPDMKAVIEAQRLCFAATVSPDGIPNLSPKGTIRVGDDHTIWFLDIASPTTRANLERNPWIEINVVDPLSRRGYRFLGRAVIHQNDQVHREAEDRVAAEDGVRYPSAGVIVVRIERALPLWSPGYDHVPDERTMRQGWKAKREVLDAGFDAHLANHGAFTVPSRPSPE